MSAILGVLTFVTVALVVPSIISAQQQCTTNSECPSDSCCLLSPMRYATPSCSQYRQKGDICRPQIDTITANLTYPNNSSLKVEKVHYIICPCAVGLSCNRRRGVCS